MVHEIQTRVHVRFARNQDVRITATTSTEQEEYAPTHTYLVSERWRVMLVRTNTQTHNCYGSARLQSGYTLLTLIHAANVTYTS